MNDPSPASEAESEAKPRPRTTPGDQTVYAEIYEAILDHRLPPGTKLTEDSLGEIFGVSRTLVRKALFRLAHENIVRIRPHRGAVVASPSIEEARDVFQARRVVENAIVATLAREAGAQQLDALRALVDDERDAYEHGDRRSVIRLSGNYHLKLAEIAGNAVLLDFLKELVSRTSLIIALHEAPGQAACSFDEHAALTEAIARGDEDMAVRLMTEHLQSCEDRLNLAAGGAAVDLAQVFANMRPPARKARGA